MDFQKVVDSYVSGATSFDDALATLDSVYQYEDLVELQLWVMAHMLRDAKELDSQSKQITKLQIQVEGYARKDPAIAALRELVRSLETLRDFTVTLTEALYPFTGLRPDVPDAAFLADVRSDLDHIQALVDFLITKEVDDWRTWPLPPDDSDMDAIRDFLDA